MTNKVTNAEKSSKAYWSILKSSKAYWSILKSSKAYWSILKKKLTGQAYNKKLTGQY